MNLKKLIIGVFSIIVFISSIFLFTNKKPLQNTETKTLTAIVIALDNNNLLLQDKDNTIYTISKDTISAYLGDHIFMEYTGILNSDDYKIQNVERVNTDLTPSGIPTEWIDEGLFKDYYERAYQKLITLTLDQKIGQLFLVRFNENKAINAIKNQHVGGFVFYERDFQNKTTDKVQKMTSTLQKETIIPLLTAVDEEGGRIVRISSNPNLASEPFKSSQELYNSGGLEKIKEDTILKSKLLSKLGLNLNLAPVVDVTTDRNAYMYPRSLGKNTNITKDYARTVIEASKGLDVSYTLKHFPGYGNNTDTHINSSTDTRSYEDILTNYIPPFEAGIQVGAEAILVSHNIVSSIDATNPATLSPSIHNLLRNRLEFSGVIITDDVSMGATSSISDVAKKAILGGNDLIISTNYEEDFESIKMAVENQEISEELINRVTLRILAWKYYKGLIIDEK